MKNRKICFTLILLTILMIYITNITTIPENITIFQNEKYQISCLKGFKIEGIKDENEENFIKKLCTINSNFIGKEDLKIKALGIFPVKDITVSVIPQKMVVPSGKAIGVKIYSEGVLVIGKSSVDSIDGESYRPFEETNIAVGDIIYKIDDNRIETIEELVESVRNSNGEKIKITYKHDSAIEEKYIKPVKSIDDNNYKIGLWVRDGTMGIGTTTFYDVETGNFAALGHGISDVDTNEIISIDYGSVNPVNILSVMPSKKNKPGEIVGVLNSYTNYGEIYGNNQYGVFGKISEDEKEKFFTRNAIPVASKNEINLGKATILCTLDDNVTKEYEIEILKKQMNLNNASKSMIVKVTDEELIAKTGGIVQGMSGSPVIQDGKLVGALTHVFVNEPTKGYAIFADTMLEEMEKAIEK